MLQVENPDRLILSEAVQEILETMFANHKRVVVRAGLSGGFSDSRVLLVHPISDAPELPTVVKIARTALTESEYRAYQEFIHEKLSGAAGIRSEPVLTKNGEWGGLRYHLVGSGIFKVESLLNFIGRASSKDVWHVLEKRLFARIAPLWRFNAPAPQFSMRTGYDALLPVNLLLDSTPAAEPGAAQRLTPQTAAGLTLHAGDHVQLSGFVVKEIDLSGQILTLNTPAAENAYRLRVRLDAPASTYRFGAIVEDLNCRVSATRYDLLRDQVERALGQGYATAPPLSRSDRPGDVWPNPLVALPGILEEVRNVRIAVIHGDLNLDNILVDGDARDVSLIDFAQARRDHVVHDLLRLETGIVTRFLPQILAEAHQPPETICDLYEQLHHALHRPGHLSAPQELPSILKKPFVILTTIRTAARECLYNPDQWEEYYQGLTLYLLGALKFKNLDESPHAPMPKQIAFWGAAAAQKLRSSSPDYDDSAWQSFSVILDDLTGQTVGQYEIVNFAGQGSMGTVYRARQPRLQRDVALKVMSPALAGDATFCRRFEREAQLVAQLRHPNILAVHDFGEMEDGRPYLVMDYVKGGTIRDRLLAAQQPGGQNPPGANAIPAPEAIAIAAQVADALGYAHNQGMVHRDVKPNNILLDEDGRPLLGDFGLARPIQGDRRLTNTGVMMGTPDYMAPEQAQETWVDGRADIYALGVVLFEMLTGRHPFSGETPISVIIKHINEPLPRPSALNPAIPPWLDEVVAKATAKRPEERYQTANELAQALRAGPAQQEPKIPAETAGVPHPAQAQTPDTLTKTSRRRSPLRQQRRLWIGGWIIAAVVALVWGGRWVGNKTGKQTTTPAAPPDTAAPTAALPDTAAPTTTPAATASATPVFDPTWHQLYDGAGFVYGEFTAMAIAPQDARLLYAGVADAGIYRSEDAGASWEHIHKQLDNDDLRDLKYDVGAPQTLFAVTYSGHLYKTADGGRTWMAIQLRDADKEMRVEILIQDSQDAQHLYTTARNINENWTTHTLYESWDEGASWSSRKGPAIIADVVADPQNGQRVFILGRETGESRNRVFRSDGPASEFEEIWRSDEKAIYGSGLDMAGNALYLAGSTQLFRTRDAGEHWTPTTPVECYAIDVAPYDANVLYCWNEYRIMARISQDGGETWSDRQSLVNFAAFAPDGETVYAQCFLGLLKSSDRGKTWNLKSGASTANFDIHVSDHASRTLYAVDRDNHVYENLYRSKDGGATWEELPSPEKASGLVINQATGTLYRFRHYGEEIYRSTDAGQTWNTITIPGERISDLNAHSASGTLYAKGNDAYTSKDDGITWSKIAAKWPFGSRIYTSGLPTGTLYVGGSTLDLAQSIDGGQHWKDCAVPGAELSIPGISGLVSVAHEQVVIGLDGDGIWISTDECATWHARNDGLGSLAVNALAQHPARPDELYAATDAGVYITGDGGEHWRAFSAGMPQMERIVVYDLTFSQSQPYTLYAATLRGVFALEIP